MINKNLLKCYKNFTLNRKLGFQKLLKSTAATVENDALKKIRNVGILAHIDAGKTTTTERMLYYSGLIRHMGEVHHGNTVTDFMEQERERGITIKSAAVTFPWKKYRINLIDTPGHIDFTMEVEQTLNVLDGAIVVLDSSAGVEAQTLTVWKQANKYNIPKIVFANKMDRLDANLDFCSKTIEDKLETPAICLHLPLLENNKFVGFVDLITMKKMIWNNPDKNTFSELALTKETDGFLWEKSLKARQDMIDKLSESSDELANLIISADSLDDIEQSEIVSCLRKSTLELKAVPLVCGSAYKNIGVQKLMDSILLFLPSPHERNMHYEVFEDNLCAKAFKIMHDRQRGPLVFARVYAGALKKGEKVYNMQKEQSEMISRLYVAYADDYEEVETVTNGNIAVIAGLKCTTTGNLLTRSANVAQLVKKKLMVKLGNENVIDDSLGINTKPPNPVFFCSIEPPSLAYQSQLEQALIELEREDPSLKVTYNTETSQTILAGMGELHLEIIKDRIKREYKIDADLGPIQIAYREVADVKVKEELILENKVGNSKHRVMLTMSLIPLSEEDVNSEILCIDKSPDAASNLSNINSKHLVSLKRGIESGFGHGPKIGAQVVNVKIMLHHLEVGRGTSETMIAAAAAQCVKKLLIKSDTSILEPVMNLEIAVPDEYLSAIMADLNRRRAIIAQVLLRGKCKVVQCEAPLADLVGYSTILRTITSGTATIVMEFSHYQRMSSLDENKVVESIHGF